MQAENAMRSPWQPCNAVGWNQIQIKRRFAIELGKMLQNGPLSSSDTEVPYLKAQHVQWDGVRLVDLPTMWASPNDIKALQIHSGDLLVCEGGEVGRGAIVQSEPPDDCIIQNALHRVRGHAAGDQRFLYYILRHAATQNWFDVLCNRSTIAHFTGDKFDEMWVWLPSVNHQRSIADFLDRETAKIDALIAAKERILRILAEKRRALITHAVTRGLNPDAPFRDSGISCLGYIPSHWPVAQLRRFTRFITSGSRGWAEHYSDEGAIFIRIGNLTRDSISIDLSDIQRVNPPPGAEGERTKIEPGDLLFSITAYLGSVAVTPDYLTGAYINQHIALVRLLPMTTLPSYVAYAAISDVGQIQLNGQAYGGTKMQLALDDVLSIWLPVPPIDEQRAIVTYIASETTKLDTMREATQKTLGLLRERRAALIAAAVTGRIHIPK